MSGYPAKPDGWSAASWARRLRQMADACEELQPERSVWLRGWAEWLEAA